MQLIAFLESYSTISIIWPFLVNIAPSLYLSFGEGMMDTEWSASQSTNIYLAMSRECQYTNHKGKLKEQTKNGV